MRLSSSPELERHAPAGAASLNPLNHATTGKHTDPCCPGRSGPPGPARPRSRGPADPVIPSHAIGYNCRVTDTTRKASPSLASGFVQGLIAPARGLGILLRRPLLFFWTAIPLGIAFGLDSVIFAAAATRIRAVVDSWIPDEGWYWIAAGWAAELLLVVVLLVSAIMVFAVLYFAVAGPFNEILSEKIDRIRGELQDGEGGLSLGRAVLDGIRQAIILTVLGVPALLVALVPVVGPVLFSLWSAILLGFSFFEIPLSRRGQPFSAKRSLARQHLPALLGLGVTVFVLSLLPFIQLALMPAFVAGGTILCADIIGKGSA